MQAIYGPLCSLTQTLDPKRRMSESNLYIRQAKLKITLAGYFETLTLLYVCEDEFAIM